MSVAISVVNPLHDCRRLIDIVTVAYFSFLIMVTVGRQQRCSLCKELGHKKTTCLRRTNEAIAECEEKLKSLLEKRENLFKAMDAANDEDKDQKQKDSDSDEWTVPVES